MMIYVSRALQRERFKANQSPTDQAVPQGAWQDLVNGWKGFVKGTDSQGFVR